LCRGDVATIWCLNWGFTCMCLFLKQKRRHSFQAFLFVAVVQLTSKEGDFPWVFLECCCWCFLCLLSEGESYEIPCIEPMVLNFDLLVGTVYCCNCGWWVLLVLALVLT
jgi:hypothetical protein